MVLKLMLYFMGWVGIGYNFNYDNAEILQKNCTNLKVHENALKQTPKAST